MDSLLDLVGGKGVMKFFETVSKGIGAIAAPKLMKMRADAESYKNQKAIENKRNEIENLSEIIKNNPELSIQYNNGEVIIENKSLQELTSRTLNRFTYQELKKQLNIEKTIEYAYEELKNDEDISDEPVNEDWILRFFNSVENISNEELQKVWGRILAGEIKTPNSYSYRALEVLKNMTPKEIEIFQKIAKISLKLENMYFIPCDKNVLKKTGFTFDDLFLLEGCGILTTRDLTLTYKINNSDKVFIQNDTYISFALPKAGINELTLDVYVFNQSGNELIKSLTAKKDHEYILDFLKDLVIKNKCKSIDFTAHKISDIKEDGTIEYFKENVLEK